MLSCSPGRIRSRIKQIPVCPTSDTHRLGVCFFCGGVFGHTSIEAATGVVWEEGLVRLTSRNQRRHRRWRWTWRLLRTLLLAWGLLSVVVVLAALPQLSVLFELNRIAGAIYRADITLDLNQRRVEELGLTLEEAKNTVAKRLHQLNVPATVQLR